MDHLEVNFWRSVIIADCGVMTAWSRKTCKLREQFLRFWKNYPYGKIFRTLFRKFSSLLRSTMLCLNIVKFFEREISDIVRYLPDKKIRLPLKLSLLRGSRPKICQGQPPTFGLHLSRFHPNRFTFGGVIAERVKAVLLPHTFSLQALRAYNYSLQWCYLIILQ